MVLFNSVIYKENACSLSCTCPRFHTSSQESLTVPLLSMPTVFSNIYLINHVFTIIVSYIDWTTFVNLSKVNMLLRSEVYSVLRSRLHQHLSHFITRNNHARFWKLMSSSQSIIAGGFVRCVIQTDLYNITDHIFPRQLDIIVPCHNHQPSNIASWRQVLSLFGYTFNAPAHKRALPTAFSAHAKDFVVMQKVGKHHNHSAILLLTFMTWPIDSFWRNAPYHYPRESDIIIISTTSPGKLHIFNVCYLLHAHLLPVSAPLPRTDQ